ncbi:Adaptor for signal transduction [Geranomyces variabilis]|uniref:Adaptor for signal transduction n=1 Tax=Geranomyces variabilis TaxID=109894 RepID=A0AAD5XPS3_9FUNG|nr:Adaptor for signal transduction [Geranomyces variabilis]
MTPTAFPGSPDQVASWLASLGYGFYDHCFKANDVAGDVLLRADHQLLKELGIYSVGHRIHLLRAIYTLKVTLGLPFEDGDYVYDENNDWTGSAEQMRTRGLISQQSSVIQKLAAEVDHLSQELGKLRDDLGPVWDMLRDPHIGDTDHKPDNRYGTLRGRLMRSNTTSKRPGLAAALSTAAGSTTSSAHQQPVSTLSAMRVYTDSKLNRESEPYKTVQLSDRDTIVEIIPEVLRKYKIQDDWTHYALVMRDRGGSTERQLGQDEKPLRILQENRSARFVLKHLRPHVAPIYVVPATSAASASTASTGASGSSSTPSIAATISGTTPLITSAMFQQSSPPPPTPAGAPRRGDLLPGSGSPLPSSPGGAGGTLLRGAPATGAPAVAVYAYNATLADELTVAIGDRFEIVSRREGWCVAAVVSSGSGEKEGRSGWVPSGCLRELEPGDPVLVSWPSAGGVQSGGGDAGD